MSAPKPAQGLGGEVKSLVLGSGVFSIVGQDRLYLNDGAGTYARTIANLISLLEAKPTAEVGITAVLTAEQMAGQEGDVQADRRPEAVVHEGAIPVPEW